MLKQHPCTVCQWTLVLLCIAGALESTVTKVFWSWNNRHHSGLDLKALQVQWLAPLRTALDLRPSLIITGVAEPVRALKYTEWRSFYRNVNLKLSIHTRPPVADSYSPGVKDARRSAEDETVTNSLRRLYLKGSQPRSAAFSISQT